MESISSLPLPGHAKIDSVTMAKAITRAQLEADHRDDGDEDVLQHVHADHAALGRPLARANFT